MAVPSYVAVSFGLASVGFCCCQSRDLVFGRRPWLLDYDSPFVRLKSSPSPPLDGASGPSTPSGHLLCYYIAPSKYTVYSLHRYIQSRMM